MFCSEHVFPYGVPSLLLFYSLPFPQLFSSTCFRSFRRSRSYFYLFCFEHFLRCLLCFSIFFFLLFILSASKFCCFSVSCVRHHFHFLLYLLLYLFFAALFDLFCLIFSLPVSLCLNFIHLFFFSSHILYCFFFLYSFPTFSDILFCFHFFPASSGFLCLSSIPSTVFLSLSSLHFPSSSFMTASVLLPFLLFLPFHCLLMPFPVSFRFCSSSAFILYCLLYHFSFFLLFLSFLSVDQ